MKPSRELACPRTEELSALIDEELGAGDETAAHAKVCPVCGRMLKDLKELRVGLQPLAELPATRLVPAGFAGAATLSAGVYLGALLMGGTAVGTAQPAMMAMFDAIPPGGVCVGLQSCNWRGR